MRADADFMVFVAARWPSLVKEAVLLGVRPGDAADATTDALSRCRRDWGRASREEDVDAMVRSELEAAASRRPRTDEASREQAARELLVLAPPTLEELWHRETQHNRAVLRRAAMVALPLLLVAAGAGAYLATGGGDGEVPAKADDDLGAAAVSLEENPAPGTIWYADGQLHLDHTVLAIDGLRDMTRLGVGVVYGDDAGRVVYAGDDGTREVLGHKDPVPPVAATDENGWAAWVETGGDEPEIVVKEAATGNAVGEFPVDASARVVAVDGETVYYVDDKGAHYLQPDLQSGVPTTGPLAPAELLDVRSRIQAFQLDAQRVFVVQSIFNTQFDIPGQGAQLAPDGSVVVTHTPGTEEYAAYDPRSGRRFPSGLSEGDHVVAVAPGRRQTIAYIVAPVASPHRMTPGRDLELRTCNLRLGQCVTDAHIPNFGRMPVLAR
jgi:hypothetical protein